MPSKRKILVLMATVSLIASCGGTEDDESDKGAVCFRDDGRYQYCNPANTDAQKKVCPIAGGKLVESCPFQN